jgi:transposase
MRQDLPSMPTRPSTPSFVPIVTEAVPSAAIARAAPPVPVIEVKLAGAVVRVAAGMDDATQLTAVLRAVRASASRT